jgi:diaminopimelate epimerase
MAAMMKIKFTKMVASGNDFVVVESLPKGTSLKKLAEEICDRKFGVGADGLLILSKEGVNTIRMRIFNSDGSEAQMCGNGSRCAALYTGKKDIKIKTLAGLIMAKVNADSIRVKLSRPKGLKLDMPLKVSGRNLSVNFINTGVPHTVIFVEGIDKLNVKKIGEEIRRHKRFSPAGTNVDFVEVLSADKAIIRTYERGVEDETLACGTGSVAAALIVALKTGVLNKVNMVTKSGEILKVYFKEDGNRLSEVWLEGKAKIVYRGEYSYV